MRLIDADAAIESLTEYGNGRAVYISVEEAVIRIEQLPSAQPERKKAKWIDGRCSNCGCDTPAYIIDWKWQKDMDANFCPNCGADMRGEKE
jgi:hypothetical protein